MVALKLKNLPYEIRFQDFKDLFNGLDIIKDSPILGEGLYGHKNGFATALFKD